MAEFNEFLTPESYASAIGENKKMQERLAWLREQLWVWDRDPMRLTLLEKSAKDLTDQDRAFMNAEWNNQIREFRDRLAPIVKAQKELDKRMTSLKKEQAAAYEKSVNDVIGLWTDPVAPGTPAIAWGGASNTVGEAWAMWAIDQSMAAINRNADNQIKWAGMDAARQGWYLKWLASRTGSSMWESWLAANQQQAAFRQQAATVNAGRDTALSTAYNNKSQAVQNLMKLRVDRMQAANDAAAAKGSSTSNPVFDNKTPAPNSILPQSVAGGSLIDNLPK